MNNYECNNISNSHNPISIGEDNGALRVLCTECKNQYVIHKNWNLAPENKLYSKIFKRDILQPRENLFYKYYPKYLRT